MRHILVGVDFNTVMHLYDYGAEQKVSMGEREVTQAVCACGELFKFGYLNDPEPRDALGRYKAHAAEMNKAT